MRYFFTFLILVCLIEQGHARGRRYVAPQNGFCQVIRTTASSVSESPDGTKTETKSETVKTTIANDGLAEVNAKRARMGLRPFIRDDGLTQAAFKAAVYRASNLIHGHADDFKFLPFPDVRVVAGCGALPPHWGWETCAYEKSFTYAGAAWVMGRDGNRYMHLFCR